MADIKAASPTLPLSFMQYMSTYKTQAAFPGEMTRSLKLIALAFHVSMRFSYNMEHRDLPRLDKIILDCDTETLRFIRRRAWLDGGRTYWRHVHITDQISLVRTFRCWLPDFRMNATYHNSLTHLNQGRRLTRLDLAYRAFPITYQCYFM